MQRLLQLFRKEGSDRQIGRFYEDGEVIYRQGETGAHSFVVQKGRVELLRDHGEEVERLDVVKPGGMFGITPLFGSETRVVTARALGRTWILSLDRRQLMETLARDPALATKILGQVFQRMERLAVTHHPGSIRPPEESALERPFLTLLGRLAGEKGRSLGDEWKDLWQEALAERMERMSREAIVRGLFPAEELEKMVEVRQRQVLRHPGADTTLWSAYLARFHPDYALTFDPERLAAQCALLADPDAPPPRVVFLPNRRMERVDLLLYAVSGPGNLAAAAGCLAACGIPILSFDIFQDKTGHALHLFELPDPPGDLLERAENWRGMRDRLFLSLPTGGREVIRQCSAGEAVAGNRVEVVRNAASPNGFLRLRGPDWPGMLARIAQVLAREGVEIRSAHGRAESQGAEAFFDLTHPGGTPLEEEESDALARTLAWELSPEGWRRGTA